MAERILVTGGTGLIGSAVVELLRGEGAEIVVFDAGTDVAADVRDAAAVAKAVAGCDAVVHLAGIAGPERAEPVVGYDINARGTFTVLQAAADAGVRKVVYASSINANGLPLNPTPRLPSRFPYDEDEPAAIGDWYSLSKVANEDAARMLDAISTTRFTGIRFPLVRDVTASTFPAHLRDVMRTSPAREAAEGWSYLDVTDAARAVRAALTHDAPAAPGILVAAPTTFIDVATSELIARDAPDVPSTVTGRGVGLDLSRSRDLLGFEASVLLEDAAPAAVISRAEWQS